MPAKYDRMATRTHLTNALLPDTFLAVARSCASCRSAASFIGHEMLVCDRAHQRIAQQTSNSRPAMMYMVTS
jgi:hypothetical protein